eukprot:1062199-Rhodomonas_salina.1
MDNDDDDDGRYNNVGLVPTTPALDGGASGVERVHGGPGMTIAEFTSMNRHQWLRPDEHSIEELVSVTDVPQHHDRRHLHQANDPNKSLNALPRRDLKSTSSPLKAQVRDQNDAVYHSANMENLTIDLDEIRNASGGRRGGVFPRSDPSVNDVMINNRHNHATSKHDVAKIDTRRDRANADSSNLNAMMISGSNAVRRRPESAMTPGLAELFRPAPNEIRLGARAGSGAGLGRRAMVRERLDGSRARQGPARLGLGTQRQHAETVLVGNTEHGFRVGKVQGGLGSGVLVPDAVARHGRGRRTSLRREQEWLDRELQHLKGKSRGGRAGGRAGGKERTLSEGGRPGRSSSHRLEGLADGARLKVEPGARVLQPEREAYAREDRRLRRSLPPMESQAAQAMVPARQGTGARAGDEHRHGDDDARIGVMYHGSSADAVLSHVYERRHANYTGNGAEPVQVKVHGARFGRGHRALGLLEADAELDELDGRTLDSTEHWHQSDQDHQHPPPPPPHLGNGSQATPFSDSFVKNLRTQQMTEFIPRYLLREQAL